jgi:ECF sigma factor
VSAGQVTGLLRAWTDGDDTALEQLIPLVEAELRRLARTYMARERPGHTLQTTALVNEAFLRLVDARNIRWQDRAHFVAISARLMRRVLVDHARTRDCQKRGGTDPAWSADGRTLYYIKSPPDAPGSSAVLAVDIAATAALSAGTPRELFRVRGQRCADLRCFDISADGPRFLFREGEGVKRASVTRMDPVLNWTTTTGR